MIDSFEWVEPRADISAFAEMSADTIALQNYLILLKTVKSFFYILLATALVSGPLVVTLPVA